MICKCTHCGDRFIPYSPYPDTNATKLCPECQKLIEWTCPCCKALVRGSRFSCPWCSGFVSHLRGIWREMV